jgi:cation transport ATPase
MIIGDERSDKASDNSSIYFSESTEANLKDEILTTNNSFKNIQKNWLPWIKENKESKNTLSLVRQEPEITNDLFFATALSTISLILVVILKQLITVSSGQSSSATSIGIATLLLGVLSCLFAIYSLCRAECRSQFRTLLSVRTCTVASLLINCSGEIWQLISIPNSYSAPHLLDSSVFLATMVTWVTLGCLYLQQIIGRLLGFTFTESLKPVQIISEDPIDNIRENITKPFHQLKAGDIFRLYPGEIVPIDGIIISGTGEVLERKVSGYSRQVMRDRGQKIFAGSRIVKGGFDCKASVNFWESNIFRYAEKFEETLFQALIVQPEERFLIQRVCQLVVIGALFGGLASALKGEPVIEVARIVSALLLLVLIPLSVPLFRLIRGITITRLFGHGVLLNESSNLNKLKETKSIAFDFNLPLVETEWEIIDFRMVDERFEQESVYSVLISILHNSEDELHELLYQRLRPSVNHMLLYGVKDLTYYTNSCITGEIEGFPCVFGNEEFLLKQGIYLQLNDFDSELNVQTLLFAVGQELVARIDVRERPYLRGAELAADLRKLGDVRTLLCTEAKASNLDLLGRIAGVDMGQLFGDLTPQEYHSHILRWNPCILYHDRVEPPARVAHLTMTRLLEVNTSRMISDINILHKDPTILRSMFSSIRRGESIYSNILFISLSLTVLLFLGILFSLITLGTVIQVLTVSTFLLYFYIAKEAKTVKLW